MFLLLKFISIEAGTTDIQVRYAVASSFICLGDYSYPWYKIFHVNEGKHKMSVGFICNERNLMEKFKEI